MDFLDIAKAAAALPSVPGRLARWGHAHPRRLAAGTVALLAGFAVTAFGVVPMAPDAADLPRRVVIEPYQPEGLDRQLDALAAQHLALTRNEITRNDDSSASLLHRLGAVDPELSAFIASDALARKLWQGRSGKMVAATLEAGGRVSRLVVRYPAERAEQAGTHFSRLSIERDAHGLSSRLEIVPLGATTRLASGSVRTSLFAATDEANLPDPIASQMAELFSGDIDFHRELRKGDTFSVVYEALTADGEPIPWNQGAGRVLAAEFVNAGHAYTSVWYAGADGKGDYFDLDGRSKHRAFLASPLAFSRITSGFSMRLHPILNQWKKHEGVDYGAPIGTPVRAVGDGEVAFAGVQNGYGNVVQIAHTGGRMTVYAHLSRIAVHRGERVAQGEHIGDVGMTGWATGPHLHFEFRVAGVVRDPLTLAKASDTLTLDAAARPRFLAQADTLKAELGVAETLSGGAARGD